MQDQVCSIINGVFDWIDVYSNLINLSLKRRGNQDISVEEICEMHDWFKFFYWRA